MRRTNHLIAIDLSGGTALLDGGHEIARQTDILLHGSGRLAVGKVKVNAILEHDADKRQSVEGSRADDLDAGCRIESNLDRAGVIALHLFGRQAGRLSGNFENHRGWVWIRLDVERLESSKPSYDKRQQSENDDRPAAETERNDRLKHVIERIPVRKENSLIRRRSLQHVTQKNAPVGHR